jgi:solute carrier family 36 (proton-coupled amino acid transporter)
MYLIMIFAVPVILAESIPQLGLFISLVGAVSSSALALMFPSIIELVGLSQRPGKIPSFSIIKNTVLLALGLFIFFTGTFESVSSIIKAFKH